MRRSPTLSKRNKQGNRTLSAPASLGSYKPVSSASDRAAGDLDLCAFPELSESDGVQDLQLTADASGIDWSKIEARIKLADASKEPKLSNSRIGVSRGGTIFGEEE